MSFLIFLGVLVGLLTTVLTIRFLIVIPDELSKIEKIMLMQYLDSLEDDDDDSSDDEDDSSDDEDD